MPQDEPDYTGSTDPAASTDKFRAFVDSDEPAGRVSRSRTKTPLATLVAIGVLVGLVVVAVVAWVVL